MSARQTSMDQKLDRMMEALEALAVQRVEIGHLAEQQNESRKWLKDHEDRIQIMERAPGSSASKFLWILVGASVTAVPGVVTAMLVFRMTGAP